MKINKVMLLVHVQYRPEGLQDLHARKMCVMWLFLHSHYAQITRAKKIARNFYAHSNYT